MIGVGFYARLREIIREQTGRELTGLRWDLDDPRGAFVTIRLDGGVVRTFTADQVRTFMQNRGVTWQNVKSLVDEIWEHQRFVCLTDGTPPPEGGWDEAVRPGRGGRE